MTQEDKQLLLKDICSRLPYGVKLGFESSNIIFTLKDYNCFTRQLCTRQVFPEHDGTIEYGYQIYYYRPYLRPMSSMTEEEKEELKQEHLKDEKLYAECLTKAANGDNSMRGKVIPHFAADWCNKNHFDYRGLIPMGLALEALEGMYKTE